MHPSLCLRILECEFCAKSSSVDLFACSFEGSHRAVITSMWKSHSVSRAISVSFRAILCMEVTDMDKSSICILQLAGFHHFGLVAQRCPASSEVTQYCCHDATKQCYYWSNRSFAFLMDSPKVIGAHPSCLCWNCNHCTCHWNSYWCSWCWDLHSDCLRNYR